MDRTVGRQTAQESVDDIGRQLSDLSLDTGRFGSRPTLNGEKCPLHGSADLARVESGELSIALDNAQRRKGIGSSAVGWTGFG